MRNSITLDLKKMIDVNTPIIYINDYDFVRIDEIIAEAVGYKDVVKEWNPGTGTTRFYTKERLGNGENESLESFLRSQYEITRGPEKFVVLRDIQDFIEQPAVKSLLALMSQRKIYDESYDTIVIIVSSVLKVPQELEKYVSYLEVSPLGENDEDEINALIDAQTKVNKCHKLSDSDRAKLMPSLKGLMPFEIDRLLGMAVSSNGTLSAEYNDMILKGKKEMVKKSGVLELVETSGKMSDIGGMDNLKEYLKRKAQIYTHLLDARVHGVATPKGVFIVGMPGCGKSLCAKVSASLFNAPLLKLDMGSMMGKYVGESEANLRRAIKIAEAAAPCVLWIDEIEKAFSGVGGNNDIMTRMFGHFLSWMQDKTSSVYVIATANNANDLPPELKRKGRFDEIFCVKLPNEKEREAIFRVHLDKKPNGSDINNLAELAKNTEGFNGADIESVVNEAVEECFLKSLEPDGNGKLTASKLLEIAKKTVSITKSCSDQITKMDEIFEKSNFTNASAS